MYILAALSIVYVLYKMVQESREPKQKKIIDIEKMYRDIGKYSKKEYNRRIRNGYYDRKDKE